MFRTSVSLIRDLATALLSLIELALVTRFILKMLAASPNAPFVRWLYDMTDPLLQPFMLAFPTPAVRGGYVLEFTTLFAIFVYAFAAYLIQEILELLDRKHK